MEPHNFINLGHDQEVLNGPLKVLLVQEDVMSEEEVRALDQVGLDSWDEGIGPYFTSQQKKIRAEIRKGKRPAREKHVGVDSGVTLCQGGVKMVPSATKILESKKPKPFCRSLPPFASRIPKLKLLMHIGPGVSSLVLSESVSVGNSQRNDALEAPRGRLVTRSRRRARRNCSSSI